MATYIYNAKDASGRNKVGNLEAVDQHDLAAKLRQVGLVLISAKMVGASADRETVPTINFEKEGKNILHWTIGFINRVSAVDKMMFTKNLAVMTKAGLSISQSLKALAQQTKNPRFKRIINQIEQDIREGKPLSFALARHQKVFSELYVNMVKVGETGGTLETVLKNLAEQMRKDHELVSRVKGAMIYPAMVLISLVGVAAIMMAFVVPKLSQTFLEMKIELPITTKIVIGISNFISNHFLLGIFLLVGLIAAIRLSFRNIAVKRLAHKIYLKLPVFGQLNQKVNSARFARTFSSLIVSGVDVVKALQIVANTLSNLNFKESLISASIQMQKGRDLSSLLATYKDIYPAMVVEMIQVGEKTGDVAGILSSLADFYEEEIDLTAKNMSAILEPVIMIVIAVAVGFFAVAMLQPMYSMIQGI